jgi:Cft2 family RNA processing exonuclease
MMQYPKISRHSRVERIEKLKKAVKNVLFKGMTMLVMMIPCGNTGTRNNH